MTETIAALTDAALRIWAVVGPVVAAVLATWLTQRSQVHLESRRERAAARAEHRQANRDLYMDALKLAERMRDHVGSWAILATLYHQGTRDEGQAETERWRQMLDLIKTYEKQIADVGGEAVGMRTMLLAVGDREVATRFASLLDAMKMDAPSTGLPLPTKTYVGMQKLPLADRPSRISAVDRRVEQGVSDVVDAVRRVLAALPEAGTRARWPIRQCVQLPPPPPGSARESEGPL